MVRHVRFTSGTRTPFWVCLLRTALVVALLGSFGFSSLGGAPAHASRAISGPTHAKIGGTLVIDNETGALWTGNYNPFNPGVNPESLGIIYEPLIYMNSLTGKQTPWLATGYHWSNGNKTLTFTIRQGVKWTDGQPFSANDVAYTFNLMKRFSALDLQSVWTVLKDVHAVGKYTAVMDFKATSVPYLYYIADQDGIVAQHIWSKIKNPVTYVDKNPVGTGPFMLSSQSSPQTIAYVRNPHYWQPGKPYVSKVLYPAFTSNPPANVMLAEGKADWGGQFIPSIDSYYIKRDPAHFHYWFAPIQNVDIFINETVKPLDNKLVRQALAYAIDRNRVSLIGEYGYEPPANQTGVILPSFKSWYDASLANKYSYTYNPTKARALLRQAGVKNLSLSIVNVGGNTDWVSALGVIQSEFKAVGVSLKILNLSQTDYNNRLYQGRFQLGYQNGSNVAPNPYYDMRYVLFSGNTAPIGQSASSNYGRWRDPTTDKLLNEFAATTSVAQQHAILDKLQGIMLDQVPVIPVTEGVAWYQYSTQRFTGWPTPSNPYAVPAPWQWPDWVVVLTRVSLK